MDIPFQFGFEIEYLQDKVASWDIDLAWVDSFKDKSPWLPLYYEQRLEFLRSQYKSTEYGANLEIFSSKSFDFLTDNIFFDDNGNVEVRSGPFDSFTEMLSSLHSCIETFGTGSFQATVSLPREDFFSNPNSSQENLGLMMYLAESDILERTRMGLSRWAYGATETPLKSFTHPHLGPLNHRRHSWLKEYMEANALGKRFKPKDLNRVGKREQSFKYIGATTYRPDIGGDQRVAFEVRDAHTDVELLIKKVHRVVRLLAGNKKNFIKFSTIKPFDSEKSWDQLPSDIQSGLQLLFPNQASDHIKEYTDPCFMYDVYRNFSYPLRDWVNDFEGIDIGVSLEQIESSQKEYLKTITEVINEKSEVSFQSSAIQVALCKFFQTCPIKISRN